MFILSLMLAGIVGIRIFMPAAFDARESGMLRQPSMMDMVASVLFFILALASAGAFGAGFAIFTEILIDSSG